jgi:hypothetical protein
MADETKFEIADDFIGNGDVGSLGWSFTVADGFAGTARVGCTDASTDEINSLFSCPSGPTFFTGMGWNVLYENSGGKTILTYTPVEGPQIRVECPGQALVSFREHPEGK